MSLVKRIEKIDRTLTLAYRTKLFCSDWNCEDKVVYAEFATDFSKMTEAKRSRIYEKAMKILQKKNFVHWHSIAKGLNSLYYGK